MTKEKSEDMSLNWKNKTLFYKINLAYDSKFVLTFKFIPAAVTHAWKANIQKHLKSTQSMGNYLEI